MKFNQTRQDIIMENYLNPSFKSSKKLTQEVTLSSKSCADKLILNIDVKDNMIKDVAFDGHGCAIFIASSNLMCKKILNKDIAEIKEILKHYSEMIKTGEIQNSEIIDELMVFSNIWKHHNRIECATMIVDGLKKLLAISI